ncbi:MAG: hypothetical protein O9346_16185 [Leptospiraceae bacterium]|nr:hypothetical protein [Leptospiraceae bacterium]MCZ8347952.1 hypothetical protein [Leptospiraceae bacterium]
MGYSPHAKARGMSGIFLGSETLIQDTNWKLLDDNSNVSFSLH